MAAMKHLLRYVAGTIDYGLAYTSNAELNLVGYNDSDMAGDVDDRKSSSGILYFLDGNPVAWQSQKQRVVALSSCEAEYIAGAAAACQGVWLRRLLQDVVGAGVSPPQLKMDNQSAIALSKNPQGKQKTRWFFWPHQNPVSCVCALLRVLPVRGFVFLDSGDRPNPGEGWNIEGFWRTSCYHLEEDAPKKKNEDKEIERFSDRKRKTHNKREAVASYLKLTPSNFPAELVQGSRRGQVSNKKLRWDKDSDEHAFEVFEKLEEKHKEGDFGERKVADSK
ncbi:uncharacterized protein LOC120695542 [Panicum virgatum]|uniref:uncharacterized protein LOC120695542 n=1 Tax=Panicum virgatum TaxID=38727 RepID=UPI0019D5CEAE|nr:uncharacterized protein LOC120695542 [Panicum virgatum]